LEGIVIIAILGRFARTRLRQASAFARLRRDKTARQARAASGEEIECKAAKPKDLNRSKQETEGENVAKNAHGGIGKGRKANSEI